VRFFEHFRDQRVILREQEIRARPECVPERVVDRQGEDFGNAPQEAARERCEHRFG